MDRKITELDSIENITKQEYMVIASKQYGENYKVKIQDFVDQFVSTPIQIDNELSLTSANPVENRIITEHLYGLEDRIEDLEDDRNNSGSGSGNNSNDFDLNIAGVETKTLPSNQNASVEIIDHGKNNKNVKSLTFKFGIPRGTSGSPGGSGGSGGGSNGDSGSFLPDNISAEATAFESENVSAAASVNSETGLFSFVFGIPKGADGKDGDTPISHKQVMAFRTFVPTIENPEPERPRGGYWNQFNDEVTYPENWSETDNVEPPVWMSTGMFNSVSPYNPTWSKPICISGANGKDGVDGVNLEFIYKLTKTDFDVPEKPESVNQTESVPEGWEDSPTGISEEWKVEWVCTRSKNESGNWSEWSEPAIWSKWGLNGKDGDGVEYIYYRNNGEIVDNPTPDNMDTDEYQGKGEFIDTEYVPEGWTDSPQGITAELTHEWVSIRKYKQTTQSWGPFSDPALWAKWGDRGYNGISIRMKYAITDNSSEAPSYVQNDINPGSNWHSVIPNYDEHQAVWRIEAYVTYDNKLATIVDDEGNEIYGWSKPIIISGVAGRDGMPVNYKTYVYKLSDSKPNKPLNDDPQNPGDGWQDYPDSVGQWWQCVGSVNGFTGMVTEWGEVLIVNGRDGIAQDGKFTEMRFSVNTSNTKAPSLNKTNRNPSGWYVTPPSKTTSQFMWMTLAQINPGGDTLASEWATPVCITGERGPQGQTGATGETGPMGPDGLTGIPGVEIKAVYSLGTADLADARFDSNISKQESIANYGWLETIPKTTSQKPYIWCTQARFKYVRNTTTSNDFTKTLDGVWCEPFLMTGTKGEAGGSSPIIYPAGIYSNITRYVATESKAPYVWDANYQEFYILNFVDPAGWLGTEQNNYTPGESFDRNGNKYWDKLESFDAIYANVGIFGNALVGSAVFNGNYMFSQHGEGNYENFDGKTNDPYAEDSRFKPAWCVNLVTGGMWAGTGTSYFAPDGSGYLSNGEINWDNKGMLRVPVMGTIKAYVKDLDIAYNNGFEFDYNILASYNDTANVKILASNDRNGNNIIAEKSLGEIYIPCENSDSIIAKDAKYVTLVCNNKKIVTSAVPQVSVRNVTINFDGAANSGVSFIPHISNMHDIRDITTKPMEELVYATLLPAFAASIQIKNTSDYHRTYTLVCVSGALVSDGMLNETRVQLEPGEVKGIEVSIMLYGQTDATIAIVSN